MWAAQPFNNHGRKAVCLLNKSKCFMVFHQAALVIFVRAVWLKNLAAQVTAKTLASLTASPVLAANVHALMQSEPSKLRALPAAGTQFVYAGAKHALMCWRGRCAQGRSVAWLKQFLNA